MSTKATAARIYEYGEPDVFRFETMEVPDPVGHEVLVRNTVIAPRDQLVGVLHRTYHPM